MQSNGNGNSKKLYPNLEYIRSKGLYKPHIYVEFVIGITSDSVIDPHNAQGQELITTESQYSLIFEIFPDWSPLGASRFLELVFDEFFDNNMFFRVIKVSSGYIGYGGRVGNIYIYIY